jgi:hypothetical protein
MQDVSDAFLLPDDRDLGRAVRPVPGVAPLRDPTVIAVATAFLSLATLLLSVFDIAASDR